MSKALVETTGPFQLVDERQQLIHSDRPTVADVGSNMFQHRAAAGQIRLLAGELQDAATDKEFAKFWAEAEGNHELAIASFLSAFGPKVAEPELPLTEPKKVK